MVSMIWVKRNFLECYLECKGVADVLKCSVFLMTSMEMTISVGSENEAPCLDGQLRRKGPNHSKNECFVGSLLYTHFAIAELNSFSFNTQDSYFIANKGLLTQTNSNRRFGVFSKS